MTATEKIINWMTGGKIANILARYEAAQWSSSRTSVPGNIQGAREDINSMSRSEILRRVRYFEKNSNTMQKALGILDVNVVGTGINPTPATQDDAWNKAALDWWNAWSNVADITGACTIPEMQGIVFRSQNIDGDHGIELMFNAAGRPALNLVESHRITSGGIDVNRLIQAGYKVSDGVIISATGKPLAYLVENEFGAAGVAPIPASSFVFFYTKRRAGQYRGMSIFHSGILDLHDLDDLQKFEMVAAKDAASKSNIFETPAGGVTEENAIGSSLNPSQNADPAARQMMYRKTVSGETLVLSPGEKMTQFESNRPSAATSGFWDKLENKFVQGSGLSYAALVDYRGNWGGATLRAAVTSDNRLFSMRTNEQGRKWQKIWEFAIGWAMGVGELPPNPDFKCVRWHPPRRTTVDIGNESAATLAELMAGTRTFETVYGEQGDDWRERLEQRAVEESFISDLAKEYKIERHLISSFAQERTTLSAQDQAKEPAKKGGEEGGNM